MTGTQQWGPAQGYPPEPPRKPWYHRLWARVVIILVIPVIIAIAIVAGTDGSKPAAGHSPAPAATSPSPSASPTVPAPPVVTANPEGTYRGSCDYILASGIYDQSYLVGEIDLASTGNTGVRVHAKISWPQEGSAPVTASKSVRLPWGASKVVRFRVPAGSIDSGSQTIDLLQSWQERHNYRDGCKYHVSLGEPFGTVHG